MMSANGSVGGDVADTGSGVADDGRPTRLRDVRSVADLRAIDRDHLPFELELLTVAFFLYVLYLALTPLDAVSSISAITALHVWSPRLAVGVVGLAVLQTVSRIIF